MIGRTLRYILVPFAFLLPSLAPAAEPWRFIVAGDSQGYTLGINATTFPGLINEILRQDVDLVLFTGDLVDGERADFEQFEAQLNEWVRRMRPVYDAGIKVYACRGNHEIRDMWGAGPGVLPNPGDNSAVRWLSVFGNETRPQTLLPGNGPPGERYMTYSVEHKNALIVGLDEYAGIEYWPAHAVNQAWLDEQLARNTKPHIFAFGHEPAFRAFHFDCLDAHPKRRDAFWRSLKRAGGRIYFCGHDHFYNHALVDDHDGVPENDIHQVIGGGSGGRLYSWTPPYDGNNGDFTVELQRHLRQHGYLLVEVDDLEVTVMWMQRQARDPWWPITYQAQDVWRYSVHPGPIVIQPNGAERVAAGRPYVIRWTTTPGRLVRRVVLDYSLDGGGAWTSIDEVDNSGAYDWAAPDIESARCVVRVRDAKDPTNGDASDAPFSIFACQVHLAADLNGDCYVDFADLAILMSEWLHCGNPLDPACDSLP